MGTNTIYVSLSKQKLSRGNEYYYRQAAFSLSKL